LLRDAARHFKVPIMKKPTNKNSLRNFPPDMLVVSGIPLFAAILLTSVFFNLAASYPRFTVETALLVAMIGAGLLFWAKLPLYRAGIYLSFGPRAIPESHRILYYWGIGLVLSGCLAVAMLIPLYGSK
jgi:hypothetical protein